MQTTDTHPAYLSPTDGAPGTKQTTHTGATYSRQPAPEVSQRPTKQTTDAITILGSYGTSILWTCRSKWMLPQLIGAQAGDFWQE
jgi:hypothetical protein